MSKEYILKQINTLVQEALANNHSVLKVIVNNKTFETLREDSNATMISIIQDKCVKTTLIYSLKESEEQCSIWVNPLQNANIKLKTRINYK